MSSGSVGLEVSVLGAREEDLSNDEAIRTFPEKLRKLRLFPRSESRGGGGAPDKSAGTGRMGGMAAAATGATSEMTGGCYNQK